VNFLRGLNEEINVLIFLIVGDFDCRIGERQMELLHFLDVEKIWKAVGYEVVEKNNSNDKSCNAEVKNGIDFYELYLFRILNGKFRFDTRGNLLLSINLVVV
jgi:hypothetical protein